MWNSKLASATKDFDFFFPRHVARVRFPTIYEVDKFRGGCVSRNVGSLLCISETDSSAWDHQEVWVQSLGVFCWGRWWLSNLKLFIVSQNGRSHWKWKENHYARHLNVINGFLFPPVYCELAHNYATRFNNCWKYWRAKKNWRKVHEIRKIIKCNMYVL